MHDMFLLYKQYSPNEGLQDPQIVEMTSHAGFPQSYEYFNVEVTSVIFKLFQISACEWRSMDICLSFLDKVLLMVHRKELRQVYLPFLIDRFDQWNMNVKHHILDIFVIILTKIADY